MLRTPVGRGSLGRSTSEGKSVPWRLITNDPAQCVPVVPRGLIDCCGRLQWAPLRYLTAAGFGVLTAIAAVILWIVVRFILPLAVPILLSRLGATESGSGSAGAVIGSGSILLAALLGFVGGFVWKLWRR